MSDDLRHKIRRLDPMRPGVHDDGVADTPTREELERIMSTPTLPRPHTVVRRRRRLGYALAAAAVAAALAVAGILITGDDAAEPAAGPPLDLSLGNTAIQASCLPVSTELLDEMPVAFEGTVTGLADDVVTLEVDRWFRGGDAAEVRLHAITDMTIMISPIDFQGGQQYLITATDGTVNYCGFSGPATPQLRTLFEAAYAGG